MDRRSFMRMVGAATAIAMLPLPELTAMGAEAPSRENAPMGYSVEVDALPGPGKLLSGLAVFDEAFGTAHVGEIVSRMWRDKAKKLGKFYPTHVRVKRFKLV